jgi:glycine cleavage system aminomethyltransferase T/glycine/D-amino acid oxidase-like deaminating enzyme
MRATRPGSGRPVPADLPGQARCVIIGGGLSGASIAYHLAGLGWTDIVLLERADLTSGSTHHSAGFVGQLRSSVSLTRMMMYGVELYRRLEREAAVPPGWRETGGLRLAASPERLEELRRQASWARTFGLPLELISRKAARDLFPLLDITGVLGASFLPSDGYIDPSRLCRALADGAVRRGCRVVTGTRVTGIAVDRGRVRGVRTEDGTIGAEVVVNAGGIYAAEIGRLAGVRVPVVPLLHQYVVTEPFMGPDEKGEALPTLRDLDGLIYVRPEGKGLAMGGYHADATPWALGAGGLDAIPDGFHYRVVEPDWRRFEPLLASARRRVPVFRTAAFARLVNGPEAFTPDGEFVLGETAVRGFFVAAGFCAHGVAGSGGVGKVMAEWIAEGEPPMDLWGMDIRRFGAHFGSPSYTVARANEVYETYYSIAYPGTERQAGRPLRVSPVYEWHRAHGAAFGEKAGWERVNYYEANAPAGDPASRPKGWAGRLWSPATGAEHRAARERAALFDESSFAKIEVRGPDAADFLERMCANEVAGPVGAIRYTQMLNPRGGIESDLTVSRCAPDRFWLVTGTAFGTHDLEWLRTHLPARGVELTDITSDYGCVALWGPRAREVLQACSPADLGNTAFPYLTRQSIPVGSVPVEALRVSYAGELGWELYCPTEFGAALWCTLWAAGQPFGLAAGGYRAIESLRLEKGFRAWGSDVTPDTNPYEAGLGFAVQLDKPGGFIGRDAIAEARARGLERKLCCLVLVDPLAVALGNEPVRVAGRIAGRVTSGGYGYTVKRSIAYAYLPLTDAAPGTEVEIDIFGEWIAAEVVRAPLWDPKGDRARM